MRIESVFLRWPVKFRRPFVLLFIVGVVSVISALGAQLLSGQSNATQVPAAQPVVPDWQKIAGGKATFDVASIKQNRSGTYPAGPLPHSNIPLDTQDGGRFAPTGGLFSTTNMALRTYISFAYKLMDYDILYSLQPQLPKWTNTEKYDIEARASGNPTADQYRLMMQALLADRFKLAAHWEIHQLPVLALVLDKSGKLGPQLRRHTDDPPCTDSEPPGLVPTGPKGFPSRCGGVIAQLASGHAHLAARNVTMTVIAGVLSFEGGESGYEAPMVDQTGLSGNFDFTVEYSPLWMRVTPGGSQPDPNGPTLLEALKDQLGLKLERKVAPIETLVIDHIEEPSPN
jgi:uncharacterized protein (TIGR03435 family)